MTVAGATSDGRIATLVALREKIAVEIDDCTSLRDLASLSKRLMEILCELEDLGVGESAQKPKTTGLSEFERKLRARQESA